MSRACCVALPREPWVCLQFVIVVFPDPTHFIFLGPIYSHCLIRLNIASEYNVFRFTSFLKINTLLKIFKGTLCFFAIDHNTHALIV